MENYNLQANESVLYKGEAILAKKTVELLLTNLNIVLIQKTKKMFSKPVVEVMAFSINQIKVYNGIPQIKLNGYDVEVYLVNSEIVLTFESKHEAKKFINSATELITGKTMAVRGADKVKNAVGIVDDTLGINTIGTIKSVVENGVVGTVLGGIRKTNTTQEETKPSLMQLQNNQDCSVNEADNAKSVGSLDEQIEALKKLKELLDAGIITQEEFDTKKKQIMGI